MMKFLTSIFIVSLFVLAVVKDATAQESAIVVFSEVENYPVSDEIFEGTFLQIPDGKKLKLLTADTGKAILIEGPYKEQLRIFRARPAKQGLKERLADALSKLLDERTSTDIGATRSIKSDYQILDEPSYLDVRYPPINFCFYTNLPPILFLVNPSFQNALFIKNLNSRERITKEWPAGKKLMKWPSEISITSQDTYFIKMSDDPEGAMVKLVEVGNASITEGQTFIAMVDEDCWLQAKILINNTHQD